MSEEKKCRHCAMMIPKEAKICPHCRKKQETSIVVWILALIFIFIGIGMCQSLPNSNKPAGLKTEPVNTEPVKTEPVLEVQNWHWYKNYNYIIAEGTVKNISSESIDNVVAVMQIYDKQDKFIKSDHALIEYRPILPGQTSPFKIISSYNPAMNKASIDFQAFAGGTLLWKEKKEGKNK